MFLLPNVSGYALIELPGGGSPLSATVNTGCFYNTGSPTELNGYTNDNSKVTRSDSSYLRIDASRSSAVYKTISKLNVRSAQFLIIIKA